MTYDPWADLRSRTELTFGVTDLSTGDAWWLPGFGIAMRRGLTRIERRCTIAHELAHVDANDHQQAGHGPDGPRIARRTERAADATASRRLIPLEALADALRWALSDDELAEVLDVTPAMIQARRAAITDEETAYIDSVLDDPTRWIA